MQASKRRRVLVAAFCVCACPIGVLLLAFFAAAVTVEHDPLASADAVVELGGDARGGRILEAAQLVHDGYAPHAYLIDTGFCINNRCNRWEDAWNGSPVPVYQTLASLLDPSQTTLLLDGKAIPGGTWEEASESWAVLDHLGVRRILLVTDSFHTRRATLVWRKVVGDQAVVNAVPCQSLCPTHWWSSRAAAAELGSETIKLLVYGLEGRLA